MLSPGSHWLLVRGSGSADVTVIDRKHFLPDGREAQGAVTLRIGAVYAPFTEEPLRTGDWLVLLNPDRPTQNGPSRESGLRSSVRKHWLSCEAFTIQVNCNEQGIVIWTAPIAHKFRGKLFGELHEWARQQGEHQCEVMRTYEDWHLEPKVIKQLSLLEVAAGRLPD